MSADAAASPRWLRQPDRSSRPVRIEPPPATGSPPSSRKLIAPGNSRRRACGLISAIMIPAGCPRRVAVPPEENGVDLGPLSLGELLVLRRHWHLPVELREFGFGQSAMHLVVGGIERRPR